MPITKPARDIKVPGRLAAREPAERPAQPTHTQAGIVGTIDDLANIMGHRSTIGTMSRPKLCTQGLDLQGIPKTLKSTLIAGCPRAYINKFADGEPRSMRTRAWIEPIKSLKQLDDNNAKLLKYAEKYGTNGQYCMVGYDPMSTLWELLAADEVRLYNEYMTQRYAERQQNAAAAAKGGRPALLEKPPVPVRDVSEIPDYGTYGTIARIFFQKYIQPFANLGWGWVCVTHYRAKPVFENGRPVGAMTWQPSLAPTTAEIISQNADLLLKTEKRLGDGGIPMFFMEFQSTTAEGVGSRYPLHGIMQFRNYYDSGTPKALTMWDEFEDVFEQAVDKWLADQHDFQAAIAETL